MIAVPFDTLRMARKLEASGMTGQMAAGTAAAIADAFSEAELVTKDDIAHLATKSDIADVRGEIAALRTEVKGDIGALRTETKGDSASLRSDFAALRTEIKGDIAALRSESKFDIAAVRADMELLRRDLTIKIGGMMVVAVGILLTAIRYLPPHP